MDNTEKHNTLERIRRKGLAKMLENLYAKTLDVEMPVTRLPAKHVVLKNAEKLVLQFRNQELDMAKTEISLRERKTQLLNKLSDLLKDADEDVQRDFEYWISAHIANPMAKAKFQESWKPPKVTFDDEHIYTNSCGKLTVSGADITSYFATHTAGFSPSKGPRKFRGNGAKTFSNLARRKLLLPLVGTSKQHHLHPPQSHAPKNRLCNLIKSPSTSAAPAKNPPPVAVADEGTRQAHLLRPELAPSPPGKSGDSREGKEGGPRGFLPLFEEEGSDSSTSTFKAANEGSCNSNSRFSDDSSDDLKLSFPVHSPEG